MNYELQITNCVTILYNRSSVVVFFEPSFTAEIHFMVAFLWSAVCCPSSLFFKPTFCSKNWAFVATLRSSEVFHSICLWLGFHLFHSNPNPVNYFNPLDHSPDLSINHYFCKNKPMARSWWDLEFIIWKLSMDVHYDLQQLPIFNKAVITIGTFDGVHTGHRAIIEQLKDEAIKIKGETVIITFHPHPRTVIGNSKTPLHLLNTLSEKIELLAQQGIDHLVVVPFTLAFAQQTAETYVHDFLIKNFHPHTIIIGYDHHFGQGRKGNYLLLEALKKNLGFELKEIPAQLLQHSAVSSTKIREAITDGDIATASQCLGYDYFFEGEVVKGNQLGRTIGYPTANLEIKDAYKLLPGNGVYAVQCEDGGWRIADGGKKTIDDRRQTNSKLIIADFQAKDRQPPTANRHLNGMMNIGFRPTVDGKKMTVEVNIFDFDEDIYGKILRVYVKAHLRNEQKFNGIDALKQQLAIDKINCLTRLSQI